MKDAEYFAERIVSLATKNIATGEDIVRENSGKELNMDNVLHAVKMKINSHKINPNVYLIMLGEGDSRYIEKTKLFLEMLCQRMGDPPQKVWTYFAIYMMLADSEHVLLKNLGLSATLMRFIAHKVGAVRKVHIVGMDYIFAFMYTISAFVYEISRKYKQANPEQAEKIKKLYTRKDRMKMLLSAAFNTATSKLQNHSFEAKDISSVMKKFLMTNIDLINPSDMFKA